MKDQEFQALESFEQDYKQFHIVMSLTHQNSVLQIRVENKDTAQRFYKAITMQYIQAEDDFINIFVEPIEIMDYIVHHFKDVVIEERVIKFEYVFGTIKKRVKTIVIHLQKLEVDPLQRAQLRIKKLTQSLRQKQVKLKQSQQQVHRLQKIIEENEAAKRNQQEVIRKLKAQNERAQQKIRELVINQQKLLAQIQRLTQFQKRLRR